MKLTPATKKRIDGLTYFRLLRVWRFAAVGSPWLEGETGQYWRERMAQLRAADPAGAVADSKSLGLGCPVRRDV
jgi:hypothetical protein